MVQAQGSPPCLQSVETIVQATPQCLIQAIAEGTPIGKDHLNFAMAKIREAVRRTDFVARLFQMLIETPGVFGSVDEIITWLSDTLRHAPIETRREVACQAFGLLRSGENLSQKTIVFCVRLLKGLRGDDLAHLEAESVKAAVKKQARNITQSATTSSENSQGNNAQKLKCTHRLITDNQNEKRREEQKLEKCFKNTFQNVLSLCDSEQKIEVLNAQERELRRQLEEKIKAISVEEQRREELKESIYNDDIVETRIATKGAELDAEMSALNKRRDELQKNEDEHRQNLDKLAKNETLGIEQILSIVLEWGVQQLTLDILRRKGMTSRYLMGWSYQGMLDGGLPLIDALRIAYFKRKLNSIAYGEIEEELWNAEDVTLWLRSLPDGEAVVELFRIAQIDGVGLLQFAEGTNFLDRIGVENCTVQENIKSAVDLLQGKYQLIPKDFFCPLSLKLMSDPVIASDGHNYERSVINNYLATDGEKHSPMNEEPLTNHFVSNLDLKKRISPFLAAQKKSEIKLC